MKKQYQDVLNSLEEFKKIFSNEFSFLPVATEEELMAFEDKFKIKIPDEYIWFLLNVANGIVNNDKWKFNLVGKVEFKNYYFEKDEFNPEIPFKWDKKVVRYDDDDDDYPYEKIINEDLEYFADCTNGQISILGTGCGGSDFIVVNGKEYGNIWIDNYSSMSEVYPDYDLKRDKKRLNFFDWLIMNIEREIEIHNQYIEFKRKEELEKREKEECPKIVEKNNHNDIKKWWQFWK